MSNLVNFEGILLDDEASLNDSITQVHRRREYSFGKRGGRCENAFIALSFFTYGPSDYGG